MYCATNIHPELLKALNFRKGLKVNSFNSNSMFLLRKDMLLPEISYEEKIWFSLSQVSVQN